MCNRTWPIDVIPMEMADFEDVFFYFIDNNLKVVLLISQLTCSAFLNVEREHIKLCFTGLINRIHK